MVDLGGGVLVHRYVKTQTCVLHTDLHHGSLKGELLDQIPTLGPGTSKFAYS